MTQSPDDLPTEDNIPGELIHSYFFELGRFFHRFSMLEVLVNDVVSTILIDELNPGGEKFDLIKSILGSQRFGPARDILKRSLRLAGFDAEVLEEVKTVLDHVGEIHFLRDRLAHNAALPDNQEGKWLFACTNRVSIREMADLEIIYFELETLVSASDDLILAQDRLLFITNIFRKWGLSEDEVDPRTRTWKYKSSALRRAGPRHWRSPKTQRPRLPPSQA